LLSVSQSKVETHYVLVNIYIFAFTAHFRASLKLRTF